MALSVASLVSPAMTAPQQRKSAAELTGLVYSLTPKPKQAEVAWHKRPAVLGMVMLALAVVLNIIFW